MLWERGRNTQLRRQLPGEGDSWLMLNKNGSAMREEMRRVPGRTRGLVKCSTTSPSILVHSVFCMN